MSAYLDLLSKFQTPTIHHYDPKEGNRFGIEIHRIWRISHGLDSRSESGMSKPDPFQLHRPSQKIYFRSIRIFLSKEKNEIFGPDLPRSPRRGPVPWSSDQFQGPWPSFKPGSLHLNDISSKDPWFWLALFSTICFLYLKNLFRIKINYYCLLIFQ